ncbi:MAG TPA: right-handed parallel beta-helix repeat-containing protein, partial [Pyrinomonadaceae bacterium]|nr:right-handed parallel beta-helix repeat-containing protein [Pyrinomonadaceae bacterium]
MRALRYFAFTTMITVIATSMSLAANRVGSLSEVMMSTDTETTSYFAAPFAVNVVNTIGDMNDAIPGDGFCDDGGGFCSLRAAIQEANAAPGIGTIDFNIPTGCGQVIQPLSALPIITEPVTINGYSQPGAWPNTSATGSNAVICITLSGASIGGFTNGLSVNGVNSLIRGLNIIRWTDAGIQVGTGNGTVIEGNFIGSVGNANRLGITVYASNVRIGGSTLISRNIITRNTRAGIALTEPASGNVVQNNYVGLDQFSNPNGNGNSGISIFRSSNNTVGGTTASTRNVISSNGTSIGGGFDGSGVYIFGDLISNSPGNTVQGNYIGTDPSGLIASPNAAHGVK